MKYKITSEMVDLLNLKLKNEGSCLQYVKTLEDIVTTYEVRVVDKYVKTECQAVNVTKEFEHCVRSFFLMMGIEFTGYSNTVNQIVGINESEGGI